MKSSKLGLSVIGSLLLGSFSQAATIISYSAADGRGPWGEQGTTIPNLASSTENGDGDRNGDGDIDTNGVSWRFSTSADTGVNSFFFLEGGILGESQGIDVSFDSLKIGSSFNLLNEDAEIRFQFGVGTSTYSFRALDNGSLSFIDTGIPLTDEGLDISFRMISQDSFDLSITTLEDGTQYAFSDHILSGASGSGINRIGVGASSGVGVFYVNNLSIIPEPTTALLVGLSGLFMFRRKREI